MMGKIPNIFEHTAKVFLNGCDNYSEKINMQLLIAVTTYITRSGRFVWQAMILNIEIIIQILGF